MSIWDTLKNKQLSKEAEYTFASEDFLIEFVKTAANIGCSMEEIKLSLDELENTYNARTSTNS
jgi:propanediol dehydratase small subunit